MLLKDYLYPTELEERSYILANESQKYYALNSCIMIRNSQLQFAKERPITPPPQTSPGSKGYPKPQPPKPSPGPVKK